MVIAQEPDFKVDTIRISDKPTFFYNVKDSDGKLAALIRFVIRDPLFEVDTTNSILKQVKKTGELWVYVREDIRHLTIRHPHLGVLRNLSLSSYHLESGRTYDSEIVITNPDYLRKIFGYEPQRPPVNDVLIPETRDDMYVGTPPVEKPLPTRPSKVKTPKTPIETHFQIGAGFNALSVMGPSASIGLEIGNFLVGADFVYGINKVKDVGINYKKGGQTTLGEAYDYSASRASLRFGMNFMTESSFQVVPQIGASMSMISGSAISDIKGIDTQFEKSTPISAFLALCLRVKLGESFLVHVTPQYDFAVSADDVYKVIKEADSKINAWGEGFGVCAGVTLRF